MINKICTVVAALIVASVSLPGASVTATADTAPADPEQRLAELNRELDAEQGKLNDLNNQVERAQGQLDALNRKVADDQRRQAELSQQLSRVARLEYEQPVLSLSTILGARSLDQLLTDVAQARLVAYKQRTLLSQADSLRRRDEQARDEQASRAAEIKGAWEQASRMAARTLALRDSAQDAAVRARASAVAAQAQANAAQANAAQPVAPSAARAQTRAVQPSPPRAAAPTAGAVAFLPPSGNHFAFGYCTWYVASKRLIPWYGNAIDWWANAAAYGYAEGQAPRVGAVMVTRESVVFGHVAFVESVNGDGSWTVSEMNYRAWNVVDLRTIHRGQVPLVGFIYGKTG